MNTNNLSRLFGSKVPNSFDVTQFLSFYDLQDESAQDKVTKANKFSKTMSSEISR